MVRTQRSGADTKEKEGSAEPMPGEPSTTNPLLRRPTEVEPWIALEHQTAFGPVRLPTCDYERCHEAQYIEVTLKLARIPNLPVLGFEILTAARFCINLCDHLTADRSVASVNL